MSLYALLLIICIIGGIIQTTIGFGFSIFAMIFLVMMFPFNLAVAIAQMAGLLGGIFLVYKYWHEISWKILMPFLVPAVVFGIILTWYSVYIPVGHLKLILGLTFIAIALFMVFGKNTFSIPATPFSGAVMGSISGSLNGLFAMGGPPVALYFASALSNKFAYIATSNAYFLFFKFFSAPLRFLNGSVGIEHLGFMATAMAGMGIGVYMGDRIMRSMPVDLLKNLVYGFVAFSGMMYVIQELGSMV